MKTEMINDATLETWSAEEVAQAWNAHAITLIDVRTIQEFSFEHITGALLLPMSFFDARNMPCQADKQIVLYCGSGIRSDKMARLCIEAGFDRIAHMEDGLAAWKKARLPYTGTHMGSGAPRQING